MEIYSITKTPNQAIERYGKPRSKFNRLGDEQGGISRPSSQTLDMEKTKMKWLKRTIWQDIVLPEIVGEYRNVEVRIYPFPCKENDGKTKRKFIDSDFGFKFHSELTENQMSDEGILKNTFRTSGLKTIQIDLPNIQTMTVEIKSPAPENERQFFSDVADAIINAFQKNKIR